MGPVADRPFTGAEDQMAAVEQGRFERGVPGRSFAALRTKAENMALLNRNGTNLPQGHLATVLGFDAPALGSRTSPPDDLRRAFLWHPLSIDLGVNIAVKSIFA